MNTEEEVRRAKLSIAWNPFVEWFNPIGKRLAMFITRPPFSTEQHDRWEEFSYMWLNYFQAYEAGYEAGYIKRAEEDW